MEKKEFFLSCEGEELHCISWTPEGEPIAVLQIVHGMVEYIDRYGELAEYLCSKGVAVVGHDHPGHGKTARSENDLGYIGTADKSGHLCRCTLAVCQYIKDSFFNIPNFILGHSMGSFVVRRFITEYSELVRGAVIVGTGNMPLVVVKAGKALAKLIAVFCGERHPSKLLTDISFAGYNSRFPKEEGKHAWISSDRAVVKKYDSDPYCTYTFRVGGFIALYETLIYLASGKNEDKIRKDLPVFVISGKDDPVGDYGKGPSELGDRLSSLGLLDVTLKLFEGRHEIINETNREQVHGEIFAWICAEIKK